MADRPVMRDHPLPAPDGRAPAPKPDPDRAELEIPDDDAPLPDDLFDREWPDDDDDGPEGDGHVPDGLAEPTLGEESFAPELDDDEALPDPPALDELDDLGAPEDTEVPVLDPELLARVDGRVVPARVEWGRARTWWVRPEGDPGERDVVLDLAGTRLTLRVEVVPGDQELLLLGRDALRGRFLLRP